MNNIELAVLAISLLLSTMNIFVFSWLESHDKYLHIGPLIIRMTGVFPGLIFTIWAVYTQATSTRPLLGFALLTAGMLLVAGSIELLSLFRRKLRGLPDK